jgi:hypothetical protein
VIVFNLPSGGCGIVLASPVVAAWRLALEPLSPPQALIAGAAAKAAAAMTRSFRVAFIGLMIATGDEISLRARVEATPFPLIPPSFVADGGHGV